MIPYDTTLYFLANLILFALLLLYWVHLFRPDVVSDRIALASLMLFLSCQGTALLLSTLRLGPWALAHPYVGMMLMIEAVLMLSRQVESFLGRRGVGVFVLSLSFVIHACVIFFIPLPLEAASQISPFVRSTWHWMHLFSAIIAYGAYACATGGSIGYFAVGLLARRDFASQLPPREDCLMFTRRALVLAFPWLSGSLLTGAVWAQLAWGSYWTWHPQQVCLLIVWLILTMTLHARTVRSWQGKPLVVLALLGFTLALTSMRTFEQALTSTW